MNVFDKTKADIERLTGSKKERAAALLAKAEFMDGELTKLQAILEEKGWTEQYKNGESQWGLKKSTEGDAYNTLVKNYIQTMKQLEAMVGESSGGDELEAFLNR